MTTLVFEHRASGALFKIGEGAVAKMRAYCQHAPDATEAGGILIGRHLIGGTAVVCDTVTEPFADDVRSRFGFVRNAEPHSSIVRIVWEVTDGRINGLGNWHTHAEPDPKPSRVDFDDWRGWMRNQIAAGAGGTGFFVIVGTERIRAWAGFDATTIEELSAK
jgi:integrative and conjugative element protein (TIGR02256 family)